MLTPQLTRDEVRCYASGEYLTKIKGQGTTFKVEEADLYTEAFLSAWDKLSKMKTPTVYVTVPNEETTSGQTKVN